MHRQIVRSELYPSLDKLIFAIFVLFVPTAMGSATKIFGDGDVSWHIAAGRWILAHERVPTIDPFSFTMTGQPWVAFEWLSQIIYAAAFNFAGYAGLAAVVTVAAMALHFIVFTFLRRRVGPVSMLVAIVSMDLILVNFLLARPHVLVWPIVAAWTAILLDSRDKGQAPPLALSLLMSLWANLHGSFILGFVIAGAIALDALIAAKWNGRAITGWMIFGLATIIAALFNANGIAGLLHPFSVMGLENLKLIGEWQPSNPSHTPVFYAILIGILGALLYRGLSLKLGELLLLLVLLTMVFLQLRHQTWLAIVAPLILAPRLAFYGREQAAPLFSSIVSRRAWTWAASVGCGLIIAFRLSQPLQPPENLANPRNLLAHIPAPLKIKPVFNEYSFGGPLILAGIKPFIDGRSDMYGDSFMSNYVEIADGDYAQFETVVKRYDITWTMLPTKLRLTKALDASPAWKRIYSDKIGVIHVRVPGEARRARKL